MGGASSAKCRSSSLREKRSRRADGKQPRRDEPWKPSTAWCAVLFRGFPARFLDPRIRPDAQEFIRSQPGQSACRGFVAPAWRKTEVGGSTFPEDAAGGHDDRAMESLSAKCALFAGAPAFFGDII